MNLARLVACGLMVYSSCALSLPDDRQQAINLSSDRASYENNQGIYSGNVKMSQGSLKIEADKLIIVESDRKVEKVIAHGAPARFEQRPRAGEGVVAASANTIEYRLQEEEILLQENAVISHQGSKISGDRVVYNGKSQTVVADVGSTKEKNGRVRMTLQPQNAPAEGGKPPGRPAEDDAPATDSETTKP